MVRLICILILVCLGDAICAVTVRGMGFPRELSCSVGQVQRLFGGAAPRATFQVKCDDTQFGETVGIMGSSEGLNAWATPVAMNGDGFPMWRVEVPISEGEIEYKYVKINPEGQIDCWETFQPNRKIRVSPLMAKTGVVIRDGQFSVESKPLITGVVPSAALASASEALSAPVPSAGAAPSHEHDVVPKGQAHTPQTDVFAAARAGSLSPVQKAAEDNARADTAKILRQAAEVAEKIRRERAAEEEALAAQDAGERERELHGQVNVLAEGVVNEVKAAEAQAAAAAAADLGRKSDADMTVLQQGVQVPITPPDDKPDASTTILQRSDEVPITPSDDKPDASTLTSQRSDELPITPPNDDPDASITTPELGESKAPHTTALQRGKCPSKSGNTVAKEDVGNVGLRGNGASEGLNEEALSWRDAAELRRKHAVLQRDATLIARAAAQEKKRKELADKEYLAWKAERDAWLREGGEEREARARAELEVREREAMERVLAADRARKDKTLECYREWMLQDWHNRKTLVAWQEERWKLAIVLEEEAQKRDAFWERERRERDEREKEEREKGEREREEAESKLREEQRRQLKLQEDEADSEEAAKPRGRALSEGGEGEGKKEHHVTLKGEVGPVASQQKAEQALDLDASNLAKIREIRVKEADMARCGGLATIFRMLRNLMRAQPKKLQKKDREHEFCARPELPGGSKAPPGQRDFRLQSASPRLRSRASSCNQPHGCIV